MNRLRSRGCAVPALLGLGSTPIWPARSSGPRAAPPIGFGPSAPFGKDSFSRALPCQKSGCKRKILAAQLRGRLRSVSPGYALLEGAPRAANY